MQNLCKYPILQKDFTDPIFFRGGGGVGGSSGANSEERCDVTKIQICEIMGLVSILRKNYEKGSFFRGDYGPPPPLLHHLTVSTMHRSP